MSVLSCGANARLPPARRAPDGKQPSDVQACYAAYHRTYYQPPTRTGPEYRQRQRDLREARRARLIVANRERLWGYVATHPCADCGEAAPVVLELDRRHPDQKTFDVGDALLRKRWDVIAREIERCAVQCANCHRRRTALQQGFYRYPKTDGA